MLIKIDYQIVTKKNISQKKYWVNKNKFGALVFWQIFSKLSIIFLG